MIVGVGDLEYVWLVESGGDGKPLRENPLESSTAGIRYLPRYGEYSLYL
jgi:hypothetical protein